MTITKNNCILIPAVILSAVAFALIFAKTSYNLLNRTNFIGLNTIIQNTSYQTPTTYHTLTPIASNQWYSNIYTNFPTQSIFAMPLAYKISQKGLSFSYPDVVKTPETIFGSYAEDFTVGTGQDFSKPRITQIGDWHIRLQMQGDRGDQLSFFLAHGVPYTIIHSKTQNLNVTFVDTPKILSTNPDGIVLQVKNHNYFFAAQNNSLNVSVNTLSVGSSNWIFIALLDNPDHIELFRKIIQSDIVNTTAVFSSANNMLITRYNVQTTQGPTLITLYPHQFDTLTAQLKSLGVYNTIRGPLTLVQAQEFITSIPLVIPPTNFTPLSTQHADLNQQLQTDVDSYIKSASPSSKDYFLGTWLGKGITLLQLADTLNQTQLKTKLLNFLEPAFTARVNNFKYQQSTTSLVANSPEFGNEKNNDHHLHYGYYLRAAAVLCSYDPKLIIKVKNTIDQMALDIANSDKTSARYPYLRNFDVYESHSWADGFANFVDGNDQESSSEAINAWYGVYLWGKTTGDNTLMNTGLALYNQEILGAKYYWFDIKNIYGSPYKHAVSTIVWGGKIDFGTWFSPETNMKYGIELLPITPASDYLGTLPDFSKYAVDFNVSNGDIKKSWGDLFVIWQSFYNPAKSLQDASQVQKPEDNTPKSVFLYELYKNREK